MEQYQFLLHSTLNVWLPSKLFLWKDDDTMGVVRLKQTSKRSKMRFFCKVFLKPRQGQAINPLRFSKQQGALCCKPWKPWKSLWKLLVHFGLLICFKYQTDWGPQMDQFAQIRWNPKLKKSALFNDLLALYSPKIKIKNYEKCRSQPTGKSTWYWKIFRWDFGNGPSVCDRVACGYHMVIWNSNVFFPTN